MTLSGVGVALSKWSLTVMYTRASNTFRFCSAEVAGATSNVNMAKAVPTLAPSLAALAHV